MKSLTTLRGLGRSELNELITSTLVHVDHAPDDYIERFRVDSYRAAAMKSEAVVMHPGPINRDVEITGDVADGPRSLILSQVANGVPTRMAVLTALMDGIT